MFASIRNIKMKYWKLIVLGIVLRVILMVSGCHADLLRYCWVAQFNVYPHEIKSQPIYGGMVNMTPGVWIYSFWGKLIKHLYNNGKNPAPEVCFIGNDTEDINYLGWIEFVSRPDIYWILFLYKLPLVLYELAMILLIMLMIGPHETRYKIFVFLMFNPVSLFLVSFLGGNDIFLALLLVLSMYMVKLKRYYLSMLILGFSILLKPYTYLFLLPFLFIIDDRAKERIKLFFVFLVPLAIESVVLLINDKFIVGGKLFFTIFHHYTYVISLVWPLSHGADKIFPFLLAYFLLLFHLYYTYEPKDRFKDLVRYCFIVALLYFALCFFHPQYFILIIPFFALQMNHDRRMFGLFLLLVFGFYFYTFHWGKDFFWRSFMPINPAFFIELKSPFEMLDKVYPAVNLLGMIRTQFSATCFWIVYLLVKQKDRAVEA